nr:MAG TPA: hypothetical protein [Caudoviricetes sp.]
MFFDRLLIYNRLFLFGYYLIIQILTSSLQPI